MQRGLVSWADDVLLCWHLSVLDHPSQLLLGPCTPPALHAWWDSSDPAEHCRDGALGLTAPVAICGMMGPTGGRLSLTSPWP